jgi:hypothetical protein
MVAEMPEHGSSAKLRGSSSLLYLLIWLLLIGLGVWVILSFALPGANNYSPGTLTDFPPAPTPHALRTDTARLYLVNTGEQVLALHVYHPNPPYCFINWNEEESVFVDPCLGTQFYLDGSYKAGPPANMSLLALEVDEERIWVDLNKIIKRPYKD